MEALIGIELDARPAYIYSRQVIREQFGCSPDDATLIFDDLQKRELIEGVSESGGRPAGQTHGYVRMEMGYERGS